MSLVDQILSEYVIPPSVKKLKTEQWKDLDVNSIFKHKFVPKYRAKYKKMEEDYSNHGGRARNGGWFYKTGMKIMMVPVNDIWPGQNGVSSDGLIAKMDGSEKHSSEIPEAIRLLVDGKYIIVLVDGHHRVASAILSGEKEVELNVKVDKFF